MRHKGAEKQKLNPFLIKTRTRKTKKKKKKQQNETRAPIEQQNNNKDRIGALYKVKVDKNN